MKFLGYRLLKEEHINDLIDTTDQLIDHINDKAGFVNEAGTFASDTDAPNQTILSHWRKFRELSTKLSKTVWGLK